MPHTSLRGKMTDNVDPVLTKDVSKRFMIAQICLDTDEIAMSFPNVPNPGPFEFHRVVRIEVVKPNDAVSAIQQAFRNMIADESGGAGNEDCSQGRQRQED